MNYKKIIPYKLRRALSMATIAGATLMPASCSKVEKEEPTRDVVIEFDETNLNEQLNKEKLQELANDKSIKNIYLTPIKHWDGWADNGIIALRKGLLQPTMEISPKMRGQGDFDFKLGAASKVPTDSLWFVKNGWTINKKYQNQK
ncbi:MAG: hypothetical protein IJ866_02055 [Alphaproteobacteria bacterium]|nr:hypothetical protein [Alphaproteobacteria bacterium]